MFPTKLADKKFECNLTKLRIGTKRQSVIMVSFTTTLVVHSFCFKQRRAHLEKYLKQDILQAPVVQSLDGGIHHLNN